MSHLYAPETPLIGRNQEIVAACYLLRQEGRAAERLSTAFLLCLLSATWLC
jgi:hypothetical protein